MQSKAMIELAVKLLTLLLRCRHYGFDVSLSYDHGRRIDMKTNQPVQEPAGWTITVGNVTYNKLYPSLLKATEAGMALLQLVKAEQT